MVPFYFTCRHFTLHCEWREAPRSNPPVDKGVVSPRRRSRAKRGRHGDASQRALATTCQGLDINVTLHVIARRVLSPTKQSPRLRGDCFVALVSIQPRRSLGLLGQRLLATTHH